MLSSSKKLSIQVLGPGIIIMSHTIISIVTPVYNQCEFIAETIESVLSQDIQKGKKYRVKIITQKFGNGKEDYDIAKS